MDILEEIQKTVALFDPDLVKNEDGVEEPEDRIVTADDYQNAIDSSVDPEDLNFSMDQFDDEEGEEEEVEQIPIPQTDADEKPIEVDDTVQKITRDGRIGKVIAVGELVEVEWDPELTTMEYPEELVHIEDEEELEKLHSIDTNPPIPIEVDNTQI